jgi:capsid protein
VQRVYKFFIDVSNLQGLLQLSGADPLTVHDAEHVGLGMPYIEPKRETDSDEKLVQAGFKSKTQVILGRGDNPREVARQIEAEREHDNEKEMIFSSDFSHSSGGDTVGENANNAGAAPVAADEDDTNGEDADRYVIGRKYEDDDGLIYEFTEGGFRLITQDHASVA